VTDLADRSPQEVIEDHLRNRRAGRTFDDLDRNYAADVVILSHLGHFRAHDAVETLAALLDEQLKDAEFFYDTVLVDGPYGFLKWSAIARDMHISDGGDSFVVHDGKIRLHTIYYSLATRASAPNAPDADD
jgi:hypothetical protein